jgi:Ras-related protein Rab-1A
MYTSIDFDYLFKIIIVGDSNVGKSSMLSRFVERIFSNSQMNTIGLDFKIKTVEIDGKTIKLHLWDAAGAERFRTITSSYYRGCHGVFLVYDVANRDSFENVKSWMLEVDRFASSDIKRILIGNKTDLAHSRQVSFEEGQQFAKHHDISFIETSARTAENVEQAFLTVTKELMTMTSSGQDKVSNNTIEINASRPLLSRSCC